MRSCKAAVGRVASLWATRGEKVCSTNTGAYSRARAKISWEVWLKPHCPKRMSEEDYCRAEHYIILMFILSKNRIEKAVAVLVLFSRSFDGERLNR